MIIFEYFSGIGGMHQALLAIPELNIKKIFPFDINPNANATYLHNFKIKPFEISIESFTIKDYENICESENVQGNLIWTMSPPCQPFTRQGNEKDLNDKRTDGFQHLIEILAETKYFPNYFFLENVKNFENSDACALLMKTLYNRGYSVNQFLLSPNQIGIPNSRLRYYLLARGPEEKSFIINSEGMTNNIDEIITKPDILIDYSILKLSEIAPIKIKDLINFDLNDEINKKEFYLNEKILTKEGACVIDLVTIDSSNTNCYTKGYGRLLKGSGSILLLDSDLFMKNVELIEYINKIRFFTPEEIMKIMCFENNFSFPKQITIKSRYKLLGNSINVRVVNLLLRYLLNC